MPAHDTVQRFPPQLTVKQIAVAAQALIDLLDALGGDPDAEANGDELDGSGAEDDFRLHDYPDRSGLAGAGCAFSDPGEYSLHERHGKQPELRQSPCHEDAEDDDSAEDDDPGGGNVEDQGEREDAEQ